jgi:Mn-dependent DtxR family transcriptional regulator
LRGSLIEELKPKALEYLRNSRLAIGVGDVAKYLGVSWSTARQVLMELLVEGKIECEKTTKSRIFRIKSEPYRSLTNEGMEIPQRNFRK